ncbi:hypothetical protein V6N13_007827 [Hibiscus sabdariffa]|uniref:Uncharacterized protein n=1 Tax=Hibiscus sabdariffa TaxID=183260 RepID=A0ABR2PC30_9ROSI
MQILFSWWYSWHHGEGSDRPSRHAWPFEGPSVGQCGRPLALASPLLDDIFLVGTPGNFCYQRLVQLTACLLATEGCNSLGLLCKLSPLLAPEGMGVALALPPMQSFVLSNAATLRTNGLLGSIVRAHSGCFLCASLCTMSLHASMQTLLIEEPFPSFLLVLAYLCAPASARLWFRLALCFIRMARLDGGLRHVTHSTALPIVGF